jgi:hypothetical protein
VGEVLLFYPVKYLFLLNVAACYLFCCPAFGQTEQWDTYMAKYDNKPGSVMVDMGLMASAPDRRYPNLVITGPVAHNCNSLGIPSKEEIEKLEEILSATGNFLTGVTAKVLAGTFTSNCQRLNYYYVKDTFGIRNALARMYNRSYRDYDYAIKIKPDPEWKTYSTFLYPDDASLNWMENDKIISRLINEGDSLKKPRDINFELYFKSDTDRKRFATYETGKGYKEGRMTESRKAPVTYAIIISKFGPVKMDEINKMTAELKADVQKYHGVYAGWVAPIARQGHQ